MIDTEKCNQCERDFPDYLLTDMVTQAGTISTCPLCALEARNATHGLPKWTPFQGEVAHDMWLEAIAYLDAQK